MRNGDLVAVFHSEFLEDLQYWVETDRRVAKRLSELLKAALSAPFDGIGKPEPLKYLGPDVWSAYHARTPLRLFGQARSR
jgi:toxin YoeB